MTINVVNACAAMLAGGVLTSALPLGSWRDMRKKLKLTERAAMSAITLVAAGSYSAAAVALGQGAPLALLPAASLAALFGGSVFTRELGKFLEGEIGKASSQLTAIIKGTTKSIWLLRVAVAGVMAADIAWMAKYGQISGWAQIAFLALPIPGAVLLQRFWNMRSRLSDQLHEAELERFMGWCERTGATTIIHVPDAKAETLRHLDMLMKFLKKERIQAGILCRGRKTFGVVKDLHAGSWLVRTTHDLDHFALPLIEQCLHMPVGTTSGHMVSLRKMKQVLVDLSGETVSGDLVPKELRMFDEIWLRGEASGLMIRDAQDYGIVILDKSQTAAAVPKVEPILLPRVPMGKERRYGVIFPAPGGDRLDMSYMNDIVPALELLAERLVSGYTLRIAFEGGRDAESAKAITKALTAAYGSRSVQVTNDLYGVVNTCQSIFDGPWVDRDARFSTYRCILPLDTSELQSKFVGNVEQEFKHRAAN